MPRPTRDAPQHIAMRASFDGRARLFEPRGRANSVSTSAKISTRRELGDAAHRRNGAALEDLTSRSARSGLTS
jgi:hypothetical protein